VLRLRAVRLPAARGVRPGEKDGLVVLVDEYPPATLLRELAEVADRCPGRAIRVTTRD
jgi:hypothetical protein